MRGRLGCLWFLLIPAAAGAQAPAPDSLRETAPGYARSSETASDAVASNPGDPGPDLPFTSTPELRARTVAERVRRMQGADPLGAAVAARELAQHDYDAIFRGFLDGTALRETDAGDVLAAFIVLQWMVANDATTEPGPAALRAIRRQFVAPLASKPPLSVPGARDLRRGGEAARGPAPCRLAGGQARGDAAALPRDVAGRPPGAGDAAHPRDDR